MSFLVRRFLFFIFNFLFFIIILFCVLAVFVHGNINIFGNFGQFWRKMEWSSENENQGMQNEKATILINEIEIEEVGGWVVVHFLV
jgi:hypothetical protein